MRRFLRKRSTTRRPPDTDFAQMRLKPWPGTIKPMYSAIIMVILGIIFLPTGTKLIQTSNDVFEQSFTYDDGTDSSLCYIDTTNQGRQCQVRFEFTEDVSGPFHLYYTMENFFQNHQRYYQSHDVSQLQGKVRTESDVELSCSPLYKNASLLLNPCGLAANSFFTDVFAVDSSATTPAGVYLDESDIALPSDKVTMFNQVDGFLSKQVANSSVSCSAADLPDSCKSYYDTDTGSWYLFYYPEDDTTQYLYESYPGLISPLKGVTDEHFIVWMRTAMMPTFRKLYGILHNDFNKGDVLVVNVTANYEVGSFDATKGLLLSSVGSFGGKNIVPGQVFSTVGAFCLISGGLLLIRELKQQWW